MGVNTKAIKNRISTVKNTKKITKAMQMIAAVKMRKAVESAVMTRVYASKANELMERLQGLEINHELAMPKEEAKKELFIIVTSNRGLCGSYNANVLKKAFQSIFGERKFESSKDLPARDDIEIIAIGNKAAAFARRYRLNLKAVYDNLSENLGYESVFPISTSVVSDYKEGKYTKVTIIYTNYISGLSQKVKTRQILPISKYVLEEMIGELGVDRKSKAFDNSNTIVDKDEDAYEFEPEKTLVLDYLFPVLVEIQLYESILESSASEHSSRMIAMKSATESAGEMIDSLTLEFNKGRQAAITQEISEIVGGASAL